MKCEHIRVLFMGHDIPPNEELIKVIQIYLSSPRSQRRYGEGISIDGNEMKETHRTLQLKFWKNLIIRMQLNGVNAVVYAMVYGLPIALTKQIKKFQITFAPIINTVIHQYRATSTVLLSEYLRWHWKSCKSFIFHLVGIQNCRHV